MAAGVGTLLWSLLVRDFTWFSLWLLGLCLLVAGLAFRKRSLPAAFVAAFNWMLLAEGVIRGVLMKPLPPENFRARFEVIKDLENPGVVPAVPKSEFCSNGGEAYDPAKKRVRQQAVRG
jgi:hypothetical protein